MVILKDDSRTYKRIESKYMYGKLKTWKELIKMNLHGQDVPYNINYNVTAVLKIDSIYKVKATIPRYMLKSVNTLMQKASNAACSVIQMMMDILS